MGFYQDARSGSHFGDEGLGWELLGQEAWAKVG